MKAAVSASLAILAACTLAAAVRAADDANKEVILTGQIMCAHCELKETPKCQTVIQVKEDGKDVLYYFVGSNGKALCDEGVCGGGRKDGAVTGTVFEKDGKRWVTPSKVEYAKK